MVGFTVPASAEVPDVDPSVVDLTLLLNRSLGEKRLRVVSGVSDETSSDSERSGASITKFNFSSIVAFVVSWLLFLISV